MDSLKENSAHQPDGTAAPRRKRNMKQSRETILKTATKHFVQNGYDGARVDEIVSDTETSKNLVYHYFKSKEELYVAVLERIYEEFNRRRGNGWREEECPIEGLRKLAAETFNALTEMPEIVSLLNTENLFKAVHIQRLPGIRALYRALLADIEALLMRGETAGVFRKGIDPVQLYISMSAISYHYISNRHTFLEILGFDLMTQRRIKSRRDHVVEMSLRFCLEPTVAARPGMFD